MNTYQISENFSGGNIIVENISENYAKVKINNRDSEPWCYWAFKVTGACGRTITFDFGEDAVGYFGAAVSYDLINWHWSDFDNYRHNEEERYKFEYTFSEDENEVYFAHNFLYNFENFKELEFLNHSTFCLDSHEISSPMGEMGDSDKIILLTARHHACEAPANYILEGVLKELYKKPVPGYKIVAVPFMDTAGVFRGDQGKGRLPHDHNRDYIPDSIYPTVKSMKEYLEKNNVKYVFDFHSPCHLGNGNDSMSLVNAYKKFIPKLKTFASLFAGEITKDCFAFREERITWREEPLYGTFSAYVGGLENTEFATTIESPYFGEPDNPMTKESYIQTGMAFGRAMTKFIQEK